MTRNELEDQLQSAIGRHELDATRIAELAAERDALAVKVADAERNRAPAHTLMEGFKGCCCYICAGHRGIDAAREAAGDS